MERVGIWVRGVAVSVCLGAAWSAFADGSCKSETTSPAAHTARHFLVLAASSGAFYDGSGPSFVMLMKAGTRTEQPEMGAIGIHADGKGNSVFGIVPGSTYEAFLSEPARGSPNVMLRLEINEPQYERALSVLQIWERRARENVLLYPDDLFMNNILLVKQATEELNRCRQAIDLYKLDWGIEDRISDNNPPSHVPLLVFAELKRRNAALHVPDSKMPEGLLIRPRS